MKGKYLKEESWEKQSFYALDNGFIVVVEYSALTPMVSSVRKDGEIIFHCSDGMDKAPEWIKSWEQPISKGHWQTIIVPMFEMIC